MSKKSFGKLLISAVLVSFLISCASTKASDKQAKTEPTAQSENTEILYVPDMDEMSSFINNWSYLKKCDSGENVLDADQIKVMYSVVGRNDLISLQMETFLRNVKNKDVQKLVSDYISKNKVNTPFAQALIKKYNAQEIVKEENNGHKQIQYSYHDVEYDENITLYDFNEIHPFDDEFGMLLFNNDWGVMQLNNPEPGDEKNFYLIYGGGTNSLSVSLREYVNVDTREAFADIINGFISKKKEGEQKDEWAFYQLEKTGVLENCGVDDYIIYTRIGPDLIPEIEVGQFGAFLYSSKYNKVYTIEYYFNFSKINISYEIRQRVFDYVRFFTLFFYCD